MDFAADLAAILQDGLAEDATYTYSGDPPVAVRVIRSRPDAVASFGASRITSDTAVFLIAVADVAAPTEGDLIVCSGVTYKVQGTPLRDARHLRWTIEAYPL